MLQMIAKEVIGVAVFWLAGAILTYPLCYLLLLVRFYRHGEDALFEYIHKASVVFGRNIVSKKEAREIAEVRMTMGMVGQCIAALITNWPWLCYAFIRAYFE